MFRCTTALALAVVCTTFAVAANALPNSPTALPQAGSPQPLQILNRGNGGEPESLDPALVQSVESGYITDDLFEGLTALDTAGNVVPGIATGWTQVDPTTWQIDLRPSTWSNGDPLTADDFVYAWQRYFDPQTAAPTASSFDTFFLNAPAILAGEAPVTALGVKALSPLRLQITTAYPVPFFPEILAHHPFVPVHRATIERHGKQWTKPANMVSNGAFTLADWRVNDRVTLQRNPRYWDADAVILSQVNFLTIEDHASEYKLYQAGELDMTRGIPAGSFPRLKAEPGAELKSIPSLNLRYFSLNNSDALLADKRVRQALSMVIDRDILVDRIMADGQIPAYSVLIDGIAGARVVPYEWAQWPMARKIETARALLAQAGISPGTRVKISYNTNDLHKKVALYLAAEWKQKLGIDTTLENMEFRVLLRERNAGNFQIARDGWVADYRDATSMLTIVRCRSAQNSNKNCNEEAEALMVQAQHAPDDATRTDLQTRAAALIMQDYPMVPLSQGTQTHLVKPYVAGYGENNPIGRQRSRYLHILAH